MRFAHIYLPCLLVWPFSMWVLVGGLAAHKAARARCEVALEVYDMEGHVFQSAHTTQHTQHDMTSPNLQHLTCSSFASGPLTGGCCGLGCADDWSLPNARVAIAHVAEFSHRCLERQGPMPSMPKL